MYLGRVEAALAIPMFAATAGAAATTAWAWVSRRRLERKDRRAADIALWMSLPGALLPIVGVGLMLVCFTYGRTHPLWQYTTSADEAYWDLWGQWFLLAIFVLPLAALLSLLSFLAYVRGGSWRSLLAVRVSVLVASCLVWYGTLTNFPDC